MLTECNFADKVEKLCSCR